MRPPLQDQGEVDEIRLFRNPDGHLLESETTTGLAGGDPQAGKATNSLLIPMIPVIAEDLVVAEGQVALVMTPTTSAALLEGRSVAWKE